MNNPIPKINDQVERIDLSKMFGRVIKIISNTKVKVIWAEENIESTELIKNLALVERR